MRWGKKIRIARRTKKLTLHKVAIQCNVDIHTICYIENGKTNPHILILKSIADLLKMDVKGVFVNLIMNNKKKPKEASQLFENIKKASVKGNPEPKTKP